MSLFDATLLAAWLYVDVVPDSAPEQDWMTALWKNCSAWDQMDSDFSNQKLTFEGKAVLPVLS
jgi:hypothetical protein